MRKRLFSCCIVIGMLLPQVAEAREPVPRGLNLQELLARVDKNPGLSATLLRWKATVSTSQYAGSLEAPHLSVGIMNLPSLAGPSLTLSQSLPGGDKLHLRSLSASQQAEAAREAYEQKRLTIDRDLKQAYDDYVTMTQSLRLLDRIRAQFKSLQAIARTKFSVGSGLMQDVLRAQLEISKLETRAIAFEQEKQTAQARLNSLVDRSLDAPIVASSNLPDPVGALNEGSQETQSEADNPRLKALKAQISASEAQLAIARQNRTIPDFNVGIQAGESMPGNMGYIGGMVGINLPWLAPDRYHEQAIAAENQVTAKKAQYQDQLLALRYRIRVLDSQLDRYRGQIALLRMDTLLQANQALNASLAAYQTNKADFTTVVENQTAVFDAQMEVLLDLDAYHKTLAALEAEMGGLSTPEEGSHAS